MLAGVAVRRVAGGGSQPEIGPGQHPKLVLLEEIDGGIKDRPLAVVALDRRKVGLRICPYLISGASGATCRRVGGPLHIQHWRQGVRGARHMVDKPAGLRGGRAAAMVEELIGTPHHARRVGIFPIGKNSGSTRSPPSVAFMRAKLTPLLRAVGQSIVPCQTEMSMPCTACVEGSGPAQSLAGSISSKFGAKICTATGALGCAGCSFAPQATRTRPRARKLSGRDIGMKPASWLRLCHQRVIPLGEKLPKKHWR